MAQRAKVDRLAIHRRGRPKSVVGLTRPGDPHARGKGNRNRGLKGLPPIPAITRSPIRLARARDRKTRGAPRLFAPGVAVGAKRSHKTRFAGRRGFPRRESPRNQGKGIRSRFPASNCPEGPARAMQTLPAARWARKCSDWKAQSRGTGPGPRRPPNHGSRDGHTLLGPGVGRGSRVGPAATGQASRLQQ